MNPVEYQHYQWKALQELSLKGLDVFVILVREHRLHDFKLNMAGSALDIIWNVFLSISLLRPRPQEKTSDEPMGYSVAISWFESFQDC